MPAPQGAAALDLNEGGEGQMGFPAEGQGSRAFTPHHEVPCGDLSPGPAISLESAHAHCA